jgi:hypothetical protein
MTDYKFSMLTLLFEAPFIDTEIFKLIYKTPRQDILRLTKNGLVERFQGIKYNCIFNYAYRLTDEGKSYYLGLCMEKKYAQFSCENDIPQIKKLYQTKVSFTRKSYLPPGHTHFRSLHLIKLWALFKMTDYFRYKLLWDRVRVPEDYPLLGLPDLVMCNSLYDSNRKADLRDLLMIEWEFSEKNQKQIFNRIDVLTRNNFKFLVIASHNEALLKNYANVIRRAVRGGLHFQGRGIIKFNDRFYSSHLYTRIWFLNIDPNEMEDYSVNGLEGVELRRFDNSDFDPHGGWEFDNKTGKSDRAKIAYPEIKGKNSIVFKQILEAAVK